jgi:hypothetical protein
VENANSLDRELSEDFNRYDNLINKQKNYSAKKSKIFKSSNTCTNLPLIKELDEKEQVKKKLDFENEKNLVDSCSVMSTEISHIDKDNKILEECKIKFL